MVLHFKEVYFGWYDYYCYYYRTHNYVDADNLSHLIVGLAGESCFTNLQALHDVRLRLMHEFGMCFACRR